jgi:hypothetical protein
MEQRCEMDTGNGKEKQIFLHPTDYVPVLCTYIKRNKHTPWSESASELYRPSDRRLSAK